MDQAHANSIGEWDPNSFVNEPWDHQYGVSFDPNHGHHAPDNGYHTHTHTHTHTPDAFIGTSSQINPQLSAPDNQPGLYRQFEFYQQPPNDVWSGQVPSGGPYSQEPSIPQSFYAGQQPSTDAGRTVDSRFALVDEYQDHHLPVQENQETLSHGFGGHVAHTPNPTPDSFLHGNVAAHWGQRIPTPTSGYLPNREYENPLAAPQAINIQSQAARGSPSPFTATHGPVPGPVPPYQVNSHQPAENRTPQPQYVQTINSQPIQNRASIAQLPVARSSASPRVVSQPIVQDGPVPLLPPQSKPQPKGQLPLGAQQVSQVPNHIQTQQFSSVQPKAVQQPARSVQQPAHSVQQPAHSVQQPAHSAQQPALSVSALSVQQPAPSVPSPEKNSAAGVKRRPVSEIQESKLGVKKTKVAGSTGSNTGSPSAVAALAESPLPVSFAGSFVVDEKLLEEARERPLGTWQGVPNLAIGESPVKLKKGPPTKRYVVIAAKGSRSPLFPDLPRGWTPAESLGNHSDAYQNARNDLDRQRADTRLEIEMKRGGNEIPSDWWKKVPRGDSATEARRMDPPPEPINTVVKASESLRIHPAHKPNRRVLLQAFDDYYSLVLEKATELKNSPALDKLAKLANRKIKNPASFNSTEFEALRQELVPLRTQLEAAIVEGLKDGDPRVLRKVGEKSSVPVRLLNILINLINIGDANSSLAKAILGLFGAFTSVKPSQLESWKFPSTRVKLLAQGDSEVKDLVAAIFANAEKNEDKDVDEMKTSRETSASSEAKRPAKVASRVPSASLGAKRAREDDSGGDSRSSKKAATESKPPVAAPASVGNGKLPTVSTKATVVKPPSSKPPTTTPGPTAATILPKARAGLLLPGKVRPPTKAPVKPELVKAEAPKSLPKPETVSKPQSAVTKVEVPKPTIAKPQVPAPSGGDSAKPAKSKVPEPPQPSRFASLMAEIDQPKKVVAPTPPPVSAPDHNETEDQKVRRLRKEERRRLGLKVVFKGEDRLVEIREFTRHPDEIAFTNSATGEVKSESKNMMEEGMALKKGHLGEIHPWEEPVGVDFSVIPQDQREKAFVTRGGVKSFYTEQQKFTEDREARELMVVYTDPSDIPPTPKSPHYEPVLDYDDVLEGSSIKLPETPEFGEIRQRGLDHEQQGFHRALQAARLRLESQKNADYADFTKALKSVSSIAQTYNGYPAAMETAPVAEAATTARQPEPRVVLDPATAELRDQQTYQLLMSDRVKNFQELDRYDPLRPKTVRRFDYPDPAVQRAADYIEGVVELFRQSQPAIPKTEAAQPTAAVAPQAATQDYAAAWAQYYAQQPAQQGQQAQPQAQGQPPSQQWYAQQQLGAYTQPANPYLQPQAPQPANPQQNTDLSAILSALGGQQLQQAPAAADPAQIQALMAALSQPQAAQPAIPGLPGSAVSNEDLFMSMMKLAQQQQQGQAASSAQAAPSYSASYTYTHPDRDRDVRERERDRDRDHHHNNGNGRGGKNKNRDRDRDRDADGTGGDIPEHLRGINRSLIGTKQCSFWARGQCAKGDKCTFRHD